ncbi:hypothetical protein Tco_1382497, partial [Tanacetum coccineum]
MIYCKSRSFFKSNSMSLIGDTVNMDGNRNESCNLEAELLKSQNALNDLLKSHSNLEKHCISLECSIQLNQEIFQKRESCNNQNALEIPEFFENNDLKAQLQEKDNTICKLKDIIKSLREKSKERNVNYDYCEIETKNVELENSVAKLLSENERLCMFKLDLEPLVPRLLQNREMHIEYIKYTQEQVDILWGIELLVYVRDICPNAIKPSAKKVAVTPKNNVKKVNFAESFTSSSNIKQVESTTTSDSNTPVLSHTGLNCSTSNCGSTPTCNKKNDRISPTTSRNMKNKVDAQPRKVNKKNHVVEPICDVDVNHLLLNVNSEPICANCKKSMLDGVYDKCCLDSSLVQLDSGTTILQELWDMLAKDGLARGIPRLKFHKDHLCSAYTLGKSKKSSHKPKAEDTNQEKLYLLHMDLCGPICVASINGKRYNKTPYELMQDKKPDLSFFYVFGALCYPTNDNDDLGKLDAKADLLTVMASEQFISGLRLYSMTPATSSLGLVPNTISQQPYIPPNRDDWDHLFQP